MEVAIAICSTAGPVLPTGKKRVGSESRHEADSLQSVMVIEVVMVFKKSSPGLKFFRFTNPFVLQVYDCEPFHKDGPTKGPDR